MNVLMRYATYHAHEGSAKQHKKHQMEMKDECTWVHHCDWPSHAHCVIAMHGRHTHFHCKCLTLRVFLMALYKLRGQTKSLSVVIDRTAQMWSKVVALKITPNLPRAAQRADVSPGGGGGERTNATPHSTDGGCQRATLAWWRCHQTLWENAS